MRKIKVVHILNLDVGIKIHLHNYLLYLREQGYDVSVICTPGEFIPHDMPTPEGIFVKAIPFSHKITPLKDLVTLVKLFSYFRRERFDIVHTHTIKPGLLGRIAAALTGVPISIYTIHGFRFYKGISKRALYFYAVIEKVGALFSDLLLSQNRGDISIAIEKGICSPGKVKYLGNGIDIKRFHPDRFSSSLIREKRSQLGLTAADRVVGMIGRLVVEKGYRELLQAARILKEKGERVKFLCLGAVHDNYKGAIDLPALIADYALEDMVFYLGMRSDIPELIATMDVLVLPSYGEGFPRVIMEAAAMGKPVIATNVRGIREIVKDGITGRLIPVKEAPPLAEAIMEVLSHPAKSQQMGRAGRKLAEEEFDEKGYFYRTDAEYRRLLGKKRPLLSLEQLKPLAVTKSARVNADEALAP